MLIVFNKMTGLEYYFEDNEEAYNYTLSLEGFGEIYEVSGRRVPLSTLKRKVKGETYGPVHRVQRSYWRTNRI